MKKFSYVARDAKGTQSKGMIVANDEKEFMLKLNERGLVCVDFLLIRLLIYFFYC